jgi:hypothetical protein
MTNKAKLSDRPTVPCGGSRLLDGPVDRFNGAHFDLSFGHFGSSRRSILPYFQTQL